MSLASKGAYGSVFGWHPFTYLLYVICTQLADFVGLQQGTCTAMYVFTLSLSRKLAVSGLLPVFQFECAVEPKP